MRNLNVSLKVKIVIFSLLYLTCIIGQSNALKYKFGFSTDTDGNGIIFRAAQYKPNSFNTPPGNGKSYALFDGTFEVKSNDSDSGSSSIKDDPKKLAPIDLVFYNSDDDSRIGYSDDGVFSLCCTQALYNAGKCSEVGSIIIDTAAKSTISDFTTYTQSDITDNTIFAVNLDFQPLSLNSPVQLPIQYNVTKEGVYYLMVVSCKAIVFKNYTNIYTSGVVSFMNPFGYLGGERFPLLYFDLVLAILYLLTSLLWLALSFRFRKTLLPLQYWIGLVISLGFLEMITSYGVYSTANKKGSFSKAALFFQFLFFTIGHAFARLLVLIVSMGYGILIPTLTRITKYKIGVLTALYIFFRFLMSYADTSISGIILSIPVSVIDTVYYYWIFISLINIFNNLKLKRQQAKLKTIKSFCIVLVISAIISGLLLIVSLIVLSRPRDKVWKSLWIWDAVWDMLYFLILCSIVWIWRPSEISHTLGYNEITDIDDEDVTLEPIGGVSITHRLSVLRENDDGEQIGVTQDKEELEEQKREREQAMSEADEYEQYKKDVANTFEFN
ncbi:seven transmembrane domain protein [Heterostelium album PN500]|uniref:Seven transmembrane domain protein n=1 Tax=Heterostelium pallidum (strain ATCC 26659 / Pp 5 / PN500) TaxID=670386 RepID=D3B2C2_HETP5|nr:seven transmembrane domain protein [Heterostelium album PN500]EFA84497.1 seven transmembrane domain protein [Heterostelium album PN500]|eukprot:XP_020436611.1 seven transmembrane domain protein [Heterostelium album PN500]